MIQKTEIRCKKCNEFICYAEDLMYYVIYNDIKCPKCGDIVIANNQPTYGSDNSRYNISMSMN